MVNTHVGKLSTISGLSHDGLEARTHQADSQTYDSARLLDVFGLVPARLGTIQHGESAVEAVSQHRCKFSEVYPVCVSY